MTDPKVKNDLLQFLQSHDVATLATIKPDGMPHLTTLYILADDDLHFYFLTKNETTKFRNLGENQKVALLITDVATLQTVQIEGTAKEVSYTTDYKKQMDEYTKMLENTKKDWAKIPINHLPNSGYYSFIRVSPSWIRWSDFKNWAHSVRFEEHYS